MAAMDAEIQRLLGLLVQSMAVVVSGGVRKNGVVGVEGLVKIVSK